MYYARIEKGKAPCIGEADFLHEGEAEITEEQFNAYRQDIINICKWAQDVYSGSAKMEAVPEQYKEVVQSRVDERKAADEARKNAPVSYAELGRMMQEVL